MPEQPGSRTEQGPGEDRYPYFTEDGLNQCPWCGEGLHLDGGGPKTGPWLTENGSEVDVHIEVDPNTKCYCPSCYKEKQAEKNASKNRGLCDSHE